MIGPNICTYLFEYIGSKWLSQNELKAELKVDLFFMSSVWTLYNIWENINKIMYISDRGSYFAHIILYIRKQMAISELN